MKKEKISGLKAVYRKVKDGYIAYVEEIPGVNTQGSDLKKQRKTFWTPLGLFLR